MGWASYREDIASRINSRKASLQLSPNPAPPQKPRSAKPMNPLKKFVSSQARPLPVIVLADVSGSMKDNGKIEALNTALKDMVSAFAEEEVGRAEIHVAVITFGKAVKLHLELTSAAQVKLKPLAADGKTPLGTALDMVRELVEDRQKISGRAYTPAVVLVSDGQPDEGWEPALKRLLQSERAQKAQRFALGIGDDADAAILRQFIAKPNGKVYGAADARQIKSFFRWVTMSVTTRSRSTTPESVPREELPPDDLNELL